MPLQLRLILHRPNLHLIGILLQHALVMVFPELLRRILASDALENLGAARMLVYESWEEKKAQSATEMICDL